MKGPFTSPTRLLTAAVCLLLLGLSSCAPDCRDQTCECWGQYQNFTFLAFDTDSLNQGYRAAELRGAYAVRYATSAPSAAPDTTALRPGADGPAGFKRLGVTLDFLFAPQPGSRQSFAAYNYAIVLPRPGRRYEITDIELAGEQSSDRCCPCYTLTRRRLRLDGQYVVADEPSFDPVATLRR